MDIQVSFGTDRNVWVQIGSISKQVKSVDDTAVGGVLEGDNAMEGFA